jgi:F0F1-type ATP synthase membrane subunit b/b'
MFQRQEARRQQALQIRTQAVADARVKAQSRVKQAKAELEQDKQTAQIALQGESARLASEIIRAVLQPAGTGGVR